MVGAPCVGTWSQPSKAGIKPTHLNFQLSQAHLSGDVHAWQGISRQIYAQAAAIVKKRCGKSRLLRHRQNFRRNRLRIAKRIGEGPDRSAQSLPQSPPCSRQSRHTPALRVRARASDGSSVCAPTAIPAADKFAQFGRGHQPKSPGRLGGFSSRRLAADQLSIRHEPHEETRFAHSSRTARACGLNPTRPPCALPEIPTRP